MTEDQLKDCRYFEHVDRPATAAPGERVVEFLKFAYNKDAPLGWREVAVYRPLDQKAFVYQKGGWDYRPFSEFMQRYRPVMDTARLLELDSIQRTIYAPLARIEYLFAKTGANKE